MASIGSHPGEVVTKLFIVQIHIAAEPNSIRAETMIGNIHVASPSTDKVEHAGASDRYLLQ